MFETLVALFVFFVGGALASYFVAKRVHAPLLAASAGEEDFVLDHEFTYLDALEALERRPLDKAELLALGKRYAVDEATPCGRVAITYAHEDGRFEYWSERNHIPYKTLDAVARRFCVENDCRALYVDMYEELYKQWAGASRLAHLSPRSSAGGGSSDDDYAHLFGDDKGDDKGDDDDGKEEADSLLASFVRSPGGGLEAEEDNTETPPAQSVFASFKDYNAPALAIALRQRQQEKEERTDDETPMQNTFLRRGSMHDWEAMCRARATPERLAPSDSREETCGSWFRPLSYAAFKAVQTVTRAKDEYEERRPCGDDDNNSIGQIEMQPLLPKEDKEQSAEAGESEENEKAEETKEQSAEAGESEETEEQSAEAREAGVNETKDPPSALFFDRLF